MSTYTCPTDVPYGTAAQPQCMLKDVDQSMYCGLLCQVDSQCPSGAKCRQLKQVEIGVCLFQVAFADWARSSVSRKFAVGWPNKPGGGNPAGTQVAKTFASLQSLKSRYSIDDGDADMVTLKEFLSTMTLPGGAAPPSALQGGVGVAAGMLSSLWGSGTAPPVPAPPGSLLPPAAATPVQGATVSAGGVPPMGMPPAGGGGSAGGGWGDMSAQKWSNDAQYFANNVLFGGLTGAQKEVHDTVWNIENIERRGVASELFRSLVLLMFAYVAIGSLVNSQMHGRSGMEMLPHVGFWSEYPSLVGDGICYLQILGGGLLGAPFKGDSADGLSGGLGGQGIGRGAAARGGVGSFDAL